jgi:ABC-type antimicrobial peptide transport system permease subunit
VTSCRQFLVESATLSVFGAAIGIGLGIALAKVVAAVSPTAGKRRPVVDFARAGCVAPASGS